MFDQQLLKIFSSQEKMYEFEANMRNNLIFYGVPQEERETPERLLSKVKFHKCIIILMLHVDTFFKSHVTETIYCNSGLFNLL